MGNTVLLVWFVWLCRLSRYARLRARPARERRSGGDKGGDSHGSGEWQLIHDSIASASMERRVERAEARG